MKLTVIRVYENQRTEEITTVSAEGQAIARASREAARGEGQIFVTWFRVRDGQKGYLNRDGYSPVGKAW